MNEFKYEAASLVVEGLTWPGADNFDSILSFDRRTGEIIVNETGLLRLIMITNPKQKPCRIRLEGGE